MITAKGLILKELDMQEDTYYRGYRLSRVRIGRPTETVHIYHETDFLGCVPTLAEAKNIVDDYKVGR